MPAMRPQHPSAPAGALRVALVTVLAYVAAAAVVAVGLPAVLEPLPAVALAPLPTVARVPISSLPEPMP